MPELSTKPYLIRAIHQWCSDAGFAPYVAVAVGPSVRVPPEHVKNGEIVLNVSALATSRLRLGNDAIEFQARFSGVARDVYVPMESVIAIYARENGQGMAFEITRASPGDAKVSESDDAPPSSGSVTTITPGAPAPAPVLRLAHDVAAGGDDTTPGEPDPDPNAPTTPPTDRPRLTRVK
jgi:stringent starvation protein B